MPLLQSQTLFQIVFPVYYYILLHESAIFAFYSIDVIPSRFNGKVKMLKLYREYEEPVDAAEIGKILLNCNNRRLKSHLLVFGSRGTRTVESTVIRLITTF
jgi:hypothetical protein